MWNAAAAASTACSIGSLIYRSSRLAIVLSYSMPRLSFEPVDIWISNSTRRTVTSVEEAARVLMEEWPGTAAGTPSHMTAQRTCLAALQSERPKAILAARAAFLKAAEEAGMG
ncbi:DUF982 domain-containing protein [Chelatococcus sp.]|uniref:DUF982 domain-containing protein n=3 Tax=Chelatococcus sp. TaxID=1953771 RepID=UPI003417C058